MTLQKIFHMHVWNLSIEIWMATKIPLNTTVVLSPCPACPGPVPAPGPNSDPGSSLSLAILLSLFVYLSVPICRVYLSGPICRLYLSIVVSVSLSYR